MPNHEYPKVQYESKPLQQNKEQIMENFEPQYENSEGQVVFEETHARDELDLI